MVSCIATDSNNDWFLINRGIAFLNGDRACSQAITNMLQMWLNEWAFDVHVGLNFEAIFANTVDNQSIIETNIRKVLEASNTDVVWFKSHKNWNLYLKNNFTAEIYNNYKASIESIKFDSTSNHISVDLIINYANGSNATVTLDSTNIFANQPNNLAQKDIQSSGSISDKSKLKVLLYTPTNDPIDIGDIIVRYGDIQANDVTYFFSNLQKIYPQSLINNEVVLSFFMQNLDDTTNNDNQTLVPANCQIKIDGIVQYG